MTNLFRGKIKTLQWACIPVKAHTMWFSLCTCTSKTRLTFFWDDEYMELFCPTLFAWEKCEESGEQWWQVLSQSMKMQKFWGCIGDKLWKWGTEHQMLLAHNQTSFFTLLSMEETLICLWCAEKSPVMNTCPWVQVHSKGERGTERKLGSIQRSWSREGIEKVRNKGEKKKEKERKKGGKENL